MFIEIKTATGYYKIRNDPARIAKFYADYANASRKRRVPRSKTVYPAPHPKETMAAYCVRFDRTNCFKHIPTTAVGPAWHEVETYVEAEHHEGAQQL